jgi:hypothetical protein
VEVEGTAPDFGDGTEQNHKNFSFRLVGVREEIRIFRCLNTSQELTHFLHWGMQWEQSIDYAWKFDESAEKEKQE